MKTAKDLKISDEIYFADTARKNYFKFVIVDVDGLVFAAKDVRYDGIAPCRIKFYSDNDTKGYYEEHGPIEGFAFYVNETDANEAIRPAIEKEIYNQLDSLMKSLSAYVDRYGATNQNLEAAAINAIKTMLAD